MSQVLELHRDPFLISTDPSRLEVEAIVDLLSRAYWAIGRPRAVLERALMNSLVFGLYDGPRQIGLARVVSDYAVFAYLCDVIVHADYRGRGLGKWLLQAVHTHPDLQGLRRWTLATRDAHGRYRQFGWHDLARAENWMERFAPFPGEDRA